MLKKILNGFIFFIGWVLSPLTWWNDQFVNVPLSYLLANLFYPIKNILPIQFKWLVILSYYFTNLLGIIFMYFGGRNLIVSFTDKVKALLIMLLFLAIYTVIMLYLDRQGKLVPLGNLFISNQHPSYLSAAA